jgi:hypothetical protein
MEIEPPPPSHKAPVSSFCNSRLIYMSIIKVYDCLVFGLIHTTENRIQFLLFNTRHDLLHQRIFPKEYWDLLLEVGHYSIWPLLYLQPKWDHMGLDRRHNRLCNPYHLLAFLFRPHRCAELVKYQHCTAEWGRGLATLGHTSKSGCSSLTLCSISSLPKDRLSVRTSSVATSLKAY